MQVLRAFRGMPIRETYSASLLAARYASIWGINAFDQWGVELGKEMGKAVYQRLTGGTDEPADDASTQGLINYFRGRHRG